MSTDTVPDLGLGTYENTDPEECRRAVRVALETGYRHVDTAQMYGNEVAVGEGIATADVDRDEVLVATKLDTDNLAYDDAVETARASRDRLGVDVIDLLYVHWPIRTYDPDDTLAALEDLVENGVVRHLGLSNFTPALLEAALDRLAEPLLAHQVECHPMLPQPQLRRIAREHDHALVAYSPLAKGRVAEVPEIQTVADRRDASPAQVSLAWLRSKDGVLAIPKSASRAHIEENYESLEVELSDADIATVDAIERRERCVDFEAAPWNRSNP